jgi:hypothetical protein
VWWLDRFDVTLGRFAVALGRFDGASAGSTLLGWVDVGLRDGTSAVTPMRRRETVFPVKPGDGRWTRSARTDER